MAIKIAVDHRTGLCTFSSASSGVHHETRRLNDEVLETKVERMTILRGTMNFHQKRSLGMKGVVYGQLQPRRSRIILIDLGNSAPE